MVQLGTLGWAIVASPKRRRFIIIDLSACMSAPTMIYGTQRFTFNIHLRFLYAQDEIVDGSLEKALTSTAFTGRT